MISGCATNLNKFPVYHKPQRPFIATACMDEGERRTLTKYVSDLEFVIKKYESAAKEFNR